jgi:hypothetical protein
MPGQWAIGARATAPHTRTEPSHGPNIGCAPNRGGSGSGRPLDLPQHSLAQGRVRL